MTARTCSLVLLASSLLCEVLLASLLLCDHATAQTPDSSPVGRDSGIRPRQSQSPLLMPAWIAAAGETLWTIPLERRADTIIASDSHTSRPVALPGTARQLLAGGNGHPSFDAMLFVATTVGLVIVAPQETGACVLPVPAEFQAAPIHALAMEEHGDLFVLLEPSPGDSCEVWRMRSLDQEPVLVAVVSPEARRLGLSSSARLAVLPKLGRTIQILDGAARTSLEVAIPDPVKPAVPDTDWSLTPILARGPVRNPCDAAGAFLFAEQGRGRGLSLLCGSASGGWRRAHRWPAYSFVSEGMLAGNQVFLNAVTALLILNTETQEANEVQLPEHARATAIDSTGRWLLVALATAEQRTTLQLLDLETGSQRIDLERAHAITAVEVAAPLAGAPGSARE